MTDQIEYDECKRMIIGPWKRYGIPYDEEKIHDMAVDLFYYQERFDGRGTKNQWLAGIAHFSVRSCIARYKKHRQTKSYLNKVNISQEMLEEQVEQSPERDYQPAYDMIEKAGLTKNERNVIICRVLGEFTLSELAAKMRCSKQYVNQIEQSALKKLKESVLVDES